MNKKNKYKAVVALVIALAFLLPSAVAVVSDEEIVNRNVSGRDADNTILQTLEDTPSTTSTPPDGWSDDVQVTNDSGYDYSSVIALDSNDNIHFAWVSTRDGNTEIYYKKLDNDGNTLKNDTRLTIDPADSGIYTIAIDVDFNDNVHIVWDDFRDNGYLEIYYIKLDNNGNILVNDTRVTYEQLSLGSNGLRPDMAVDSYGNVHIVWNNHVGVWDICYAKLDNDGNTLVSMIEVSDFPDSSRNVAIAVDSNNNIHIVWQGDEVVYTKLDNDGNTLVADKNMTTDTGFGYSPRIAVDSYDNLHIAWYERRAPHEGVFKSYYLKADNNGDILVPDIRLTDEILMEEYDPVITVDSNNDVHIVFAYELDWKNFHVKFDNNGNKLSGTLLTTSYATTGIVADSNGNIHITWYDWRVNLDIWYARTVPTFDVVTTLSYKWNMISIPFNSSVDKADFFVEHDETDYTFADAVSAGIVADAFFGWDRINQQYLLSDVLEPGCGYWLWAYHDCVLKVLA